MSELKSVHSSNSSASGAVRPYLPNSSPSKSLERVSSRVSAQSRGSVTSQASRYSVNYIYGERDEATVALERASSRAAAASIAGESSVYRFEPTIGSEGVDNVQAGEELEDVDPELVSWESEDDPANPRNWKRNRKIKMVCLVSLQTVIPTISSSILAPTVPNILASYNNHNVTVGSLMVSIMILAWGFSSMLWAPLSELYGRKLVLIISASGNLVFNICCAVSPTTATMLVFRVLAGAFNSAPIATSAGSLADVFDERSRQWPLAIWALGPGCGPGIAPVVAGWISQYTHWSWVFWIVVIIQFVVLIFLLIFFDESYPPLLLKRKKNKLIKETGNTALHTVWELTAIPVTQEIKLAIIRPILFLFLNPVVLLLAIYLAYTYGFMYLILTDFPNLWRDKYHYKAGVSGLMYLGYFMGMLIGVFVWTALINWWYEREERLGRGKLEQRLFWLPFSSVILAGGIFWYGWSAEAMLPWPMPTVGIGIFTFALFCVFQCVQSYIVSLNPRLAGSAISSCVFGRCMLGGTFPLFGKAMYDKLGYGWASSLVAILALVLGVPWPIGIFIYGPRLRQWADANVRIA